MTTLWFILFLCVFIAFTEIYWFLFRIICILIMLFCVFEITLHLDFIPPSL